MTTTDERVSEPDDAIMASFERSLTAWALETERVPEALRDDLSRFLSWFPEIRSALARRSVEGGVRVPEGKLAWAIQAADGHLKRATMDYDSRDEIISILLTEVRRAAFSPQSNDGTAK